MQGGLIFAADGPVPERGCLSMAVRPQSAIQTFLQPGLDRSMLIMIMRGTTLHTGTYSQIMDHMSSGNFAAAARHTSTFTTVTTAAINGRLGGRERLRERPGRGGEGTNCTAKPAAGGSPIRYLTLRATGLYRWWMLGWLMPGCPMSVNQPMSTSTNYPDGYLRKGMCQFPTL